MLRIGDWCVNPTSGDISREGRTARLEFRTMGVLLCLADRVGEVVSIDDLLNGVWPGVTVSQDSVYQAVASLRRLLGDDPKHPTYIETVPRVGYRLVATVIPWEDQSTALTGSWPASDNEHQTALIKRLTTLAPGRKAGFMWAAGTAALCLIVVSVILVVSNVRDNHQRTAVGVTQPLKSIAVLPFHDLTEEMTEAPFADGMTVELIDKLSKIPGLRVHAPMSSSGLKGQKSTIAGIAKMLGVAYVVDGSVRKSTDRVRIAARLIHAEDEYVVWSETYDRPFDDILRVQDDIAGEVTKALKSQPPVTTIDSAPRVYR
jgi:TolB-like protein/DNA-binding winged helix-turn-helix (wHTH) protein